MSVLPTNLRRQLESTIKQARKIAEGGARKALEALAVHEPDPYRHMNEGQRDLRRKLRAQAKQLGDGESQTKHGAYEIKHLVEKLAYDQWHRLLATGSDLPAGSRQYGTRLRGRGKRLSFNEFREHPSCNPWADAGQMGPLHFKAGGVVLKPPTAAVRQGRSVRLFPLTLYGKYLTEGAA
jgi:hypothetical protein